MAIHRDSPGVEPEDESIEPVNRPEPAPSRRFRSFVESSTTRRLAFPRLALAIGACGASLIGIVYGGSWAARSLTEWVADRPEQQIPFSEIELVPPPDPWIKGGKDLILTQVRSRLKLGEHLRLLDLDLKSLAKDFVLGSPSCIKRVVLIERSPGRLRVHLEYRKPVAGVIQKPKLIFHVVDDEGVPLDPEDIKWKSDRFPYTVEGIDEPLIQIWGVDLRSKPTYGVPWKELNSEGEPVGPDLMLRKAARIADFLRSRPRPDGANPVTPKIASIHCPGEPVNKFFLEDDEKNLIAWGKPPGDEAPGEPSAETRWKWLVDYYRSHAPVSVRRPDVLEFTENGVKVFTRKVRPENNASPR